MRIKTRAHNWGECCRVDEKKLVNTEYYEEARLKSSSGDKKKKHCRQHTTQWTDPNYQQEDTNLGPGRKQDRK